jgi:transcriptional repressor NrdR
MDSKVIDSRQMEDGSSIRRRRQCENCGERFTTYERIDTIPFYVIKRNGDREIFDRAKLINGIVKSCNKRPVSIVQIEEIAAKIESSVMNSLTKEIDSRDIGELVMENLKALDEISYVRFASVYKHFTDIDTFMDEIGKLLKEREK